MDEEKVQSPVELNVDAGRLARAVLVAGVLVEIALVVLDYHVNFGSAVDIGAIRRLFNIAREDGLASWLATTQTLLIALTLWLIYVSVRHRPGLHWKARAWLVLALFFSYMAVDDGAQLHERLGTAMEDWREASGAHDLSPSYEWQVLFLPVFGLLGLFLLGFLWRELATRSSRTILVASLACIAVAVGLDFVEGLASEHPWNLYTKAADSFDLDPWTMERFGEPGYETLRHFSKSAEEFLEMLAHTLLWFLLLRHLPDTAGAFHASFRPARTASVTAVSRMP